MQFASGKKKVSLKDPSLKKIKGVRRYYSKGMYCYSSGKYSTKAAAEARKKELVDMGYSDAFIIAFINGERVSVKEAEAALKK